MKSQTFLTSLRIWSVLLLFVLTFSSLSFQGVLAETENSSSIKKIKKTKHIKPGVPASKLEVIAAVKEKYKGRILSIRKKPSFYGLNCHHVKMIDKNAEFLTIHVACKN